MTRGFDLDAPGRIGEADDLDERVRGTDRCEDLAVRPRDRLPVVVRREVDARLHHVVEREPGLGDDAGDDLEATPRLPVGVGRAVDVPSGASGAVAEIVSRSPERTAREQPMRGS